MRTLTASRALLVACAAVFVVLPATAQASSGDEHPTELLLNLGVGVNRTSDAPGLALRYGFSGAHWLTSAMGVGLQAMGFNNIASWASNSIACQPNQPLQLGIGANL